MELTKTAVEITLFNSPNGDGTVSVDYKNLRKAVLVLRSINQPIRQSIIKLLEENDRLTVTEIYVKLRLEQSVTSQHLAILRRAGIAVTSRDGKYIYYSLDKKRLEQILSLVDHIVL